jgi:EAL domain-containing protein (putative c-di-GMP-specific phosphodiesterase class I)
LETHRARQLIRLCDDLEMRVVAEGIQTPAEHRMLAEPGADLLQGYLLARPGRGFPLPRW